MDRVSESFEMPLRCRCGRVRGAARIVPPHAGLRFFCYCTDCQVFANCLKQPDILNSAGGTDIFHIPAGRTTITEGKDQLRSLRLSDRVLRWYTACCNTPVANSAATARFPVVAIVHSFMDTAAVGLSRDQALGPALCRSFERSATGGLPPDAPPPPSLRFFIRRIRYVLGWWLRGLGRPNPFFDEQGAPITQPHLMPKA